MQRLYKYYYLWFALPKLLLEKGGFFRLSYIRSRFLYMRLTQIHSHLLCIMNKKCNFFVLRHGPRAKRYIYKLYFFISFKMVKYKAYRYAGRYRTRAAVRRVMKNYFKTKLTTSDRVMLDAEFMKLASVNAQNKQIRSYLTSCNEFGSFREIFHSIKITGLLIETIPSVLAVMDPQDTALMAGTYVLAFIPTLASATLTSLVDANESIILNPHQAQRKYISFHGSINGWLDIASLENNLAGLLCTQYNILPQNCGVTWNVKLTFYVTFKNPK